jgi:transcriptional regulator with XRE-family HTH domain
VQRDNDLGRAIAHLRGARTQAEVSERADFDPGTWSQYETGRRVPRPRNLARILHGLGCTRREFEEARLIFLRQRVVLLSALLGADSQEPGGEDLAGATGAAGPPPADRAALGWPEVVRAELRPVLSRLVEPLADALLLAVQALPLHRPTSPAGNPTAAAVPRRTER